MRKQKLIMVISSVIIAFGVGTSVYSYTNSLPVKDNTYKISDSEKEYRTIDPSKEQTQEKEDSSNQEQTNDENNQTETNDENNQTETNDESNQEQSETNDENISKSSENSSQQEQQEDTTSNKEQTNDEVNNTTEDNEQSKENVLAFNDSTPQEQPQEQPKEKPQVNLTQDVFTCTEPGCTGESDKEQPKEDSQEQSKDEDNKEQPKEDSQEQYKDEDNKEQPVVDNTQSDNEDGGLDDYCKKGLNPGEDPDDSELLVGYHRFYPDVEDYFEDDTVINNTHMSQALEYDLTIAKKARELCEGTTTALGRAQVLNWYINTKIAYDDSITDYNQYPKKAAMSTFYNGKGVCFGKACLFACMGEAVGLNVEVISGHIEGDKPFTHAWVRVQTELGPRDFDPTWYMLEGEMSDHIVDEVSARL